MADPQRIVCGDHYRPDRWGYGRQSGMVGTPDLRHHYGTVHQILPRLSQIGKKSMGHKTKRVKWNGSVDGESLLISAR